MEFPFRSLLLFSLTLIAVAMVIFITEPVPTGDIVLDFPCSISFDVAAPSSIEATAEETTSFDVTIENMKCGISHASLTLDEFPVEWYAVSPSYAASISPVEPFTYSIDLIIPEGASERVYVASFFIKANEGQFRQKGSIDISIVAPLEKPQAEVAAEQPNLNLTLIEPIEESELTFSFLVSFAIVLGAITGVLYAFFR